MDFDKLLHEKQTYFNGGFRIFEKGGFSPKKGQASAKRGGIQIIILVIFPVNLEIFWDKGGVWTPYGRVCVVYEPLRALSFWYCMWCVCGVYVVCMYCVWATHSLVFLVLYHSGLYHAILLLVESFTTENLSVTGVQVISAGIVNQSLSASDKKINPLYIYQPHFNRSVITKSMFMIHHVYYSWSSSG